MLSNDGWIVRYRSDAPVRLRLLCFPFGGGGAAMFHAWRHAFGPHIEVCAVRLPGREGRVAEPPIDSLDVVIEELAVAVAPLLSHSLALFGHSMGALLAFELARRLRRDGAPLPVALFVSGQRAPQRRACERVAHRSDAELLQIVRELGGTPSAILHNPDLLALALPALRADIRLCDTYRYVPERPLPLPLTVFGGSDDPGVSRDDLAAWSEQTDGRFMAHVLPGNHFFLIDERTSLLSLLTADLRSLVTES